MKPAKLVKKRTDREAGNKKDHPNGSGHDTRNRIAETAYELYEQRGRADGFDLEDWLKAEALVSGGTE